MTLSQVITAPSMFSEKSCGVFPMQFNPAYAKPALTRAPRTASVLFPLKGNLSMGSSQ